MRPERLELPTLGRKKYHHPIAWHNYRGEALWTLTVDLERISPSEMRLDLRSTGQSVNLHSTGLQFGGVRWWFNCPGCFRRCACLHLEASAMKFYCRLCLSLTYKSCQESHTSDYLYAEIAFRMGGISDRQVERVVSRAKRAHKRPWVRKRDRRWNYRSRWICPMYPHCAHD